MPELAQQHKNVSEQIGPDGTVLPSSTPPKIATPPESAPAPELEHKEPPPEGKTQEQIDAEHIASGKEAEGENVDIMDFLNASGRDGAVKKEEKQPEGAQPPAGEVTPTPPKPNPNARDYSDIEPTHKAAFERMSNEAFNLLKPVYLEHKQLKAKTAETAAEIAKRDEKIKQLTEGKPQIPENYYEHENAFILTPEFANASQTVSSYQAIANHWQQQLDAVRSNAAETYQTIHVHPQTGEFYLSAPLPVDKSTESKLASYVQFAQGKMMETQAEINFMAKSHKARHSESVGWIKNFESQAFKNFETDETMKAMAADAVKNFPATFRANPMASAFAKALITISNLGKLLQAKAGVQPPPPNGKQPSAQPVRGNLTAAEIAGDGGKGKAENNGEVSFDDFKRAME